jgi:dynein heavy chain
LTRPLCRGGRIVVFGQVTECSKQLDRAQRLMGGLGGERARWGEFAKDLTAKMVNVVGDVTLSSGIIAYLGAFTSGYRQRCVDAWSTLLNEKGIGTSTGFMLTSTLGDPVQVCGMCMHVWIKGGLAEAGCA